MNKVKLALVAMVAILCFACGSKTDVDFSIVPVKGANGEYQYIDIPQKGKIVINPQFEQAHLFRNGLALVKTSGKDGKWGYIDKKGKLVIAPVYSKAQDFSDDVAWVQMEKQPPMLIDKKGKMILQIDSLIAAYPFNNGIAGIKVYSQGQELTMFIDKKGKSVATTLAEEKVIPIINDGMYLFQDKMSKKYGYRNKNGEIAINAQFDSISFFLDGMATISNGNKWGVIDKKGNIIINPQYESLRNDGSGLFSAKVGNKWGWVNKKNEITINPQFDGSLGFGRNKLAPVLMGDKGGYINREGQVVINLQFGLALPFNSDYAMVVNTDGKAGFIDKTGSFVVSPLYDLSDDYLVASKQNITYGGLPMQYNGNFDMYERLKEKMGLQIEVTRDIISVDGEKIVKTATVSEQDSAFVEKLYDVLQSKREIVKDNKAQIQIDPNIGYNVFFKIMTTAYVAGYTDIGYTSKINGNNHTERVNLPERNARTPESSENDLNLTVDISDSYIEIWARGGSLPKIFYKECQDGTTTKLCALLRLSEKDPGTVQMSVYSKTDSAYLNNKNEFITNLSDVKPGAIVATLKGFAENSSRTLACGQSAPGVEDICVDGKPAISLKPRNAYDELAKTLIMIHNRFIDNPDRDEIIIIADVDMAIWKVLQLHHEARTTGFPKIKLAILTGKKRNGRPSAAILR